LKGFTSENNELNSMNRRQYLAASGLVAVGTAGCTAVRGETHLSPEDVISHGSSVVVPFSHDGEDVLRFQLDKQFPVDEERSYYPFFISTLQPAGNQIDSLRLRFRSPPHGGSPAGISLREGDHAHKATLSQDEPNPSITILDLPDTADIGQASVKVNLLLEGDHDQEPQELWIQVEAALSSNSLLGADYSAAGDFTVEFP